MDLLTYLYSKGWEHEKRLGKRFEGFCPFHTENTPSFNVYTNPDDEHYHCYGCDAHGDLHRAILLYEFKEYGDTPTEQQWAKVNERYEEIQGITFKREPHQQKKVERERVPFASAEQMIFMEVFLEWAGIKLLHTYWGKPARLWLAGEGIRTNQYPLQIGYMPEMKEKSLINDFSKAMKRGMQDRLGTTNWGDLASQTGILYPDGNFRLENRVIFGCSKMSTRQQISWYQARTIFGEQENERRRAEGLKPLVSYLSPPHIRKVPFILPVPQPSIKGTIIVESPKAPPLLWQWRLPTLASMGSGWEDWFLDLCPAAPIYIMTDGDVAHFKSDDIKQEHPYYPGDQLAEKIKKSCISRGLPYDRIRPPEEVKDPNKWVKRYGIQPIFSEILQQEVQVA